MFLFNPAGSGYKRTPLEFDMVDFGDENSNLAFFPSEGNQQDWPTASKFPGTLVRDIPYVNGLERSEQKKNEPLPSSVVDSTKYVGKHYSNSILYNKEHEVFGTSNPGESPYYRYNPFETVLPEYFVLDASNPLLSSYDIEDRNHKVFLLRRMDGTEFTTAGTNDVQLLADQDSVYCASWKPIWNITDQEYPSNDIGWLLTTKPWSQAPVQFGTANLTDVEWNIRLSFDDHGSDDSLYIFTPKTGYYFPSGKTKRADFWNSEFISFINGDIGPKNDLLEFMAKMVPSTSTLFEHAKTQNHGHLSISERTDFLMTQPRTTGSFERPFLPRANATSLALSPAVSIVPIYL